MPFSLPTSLFRISLRTRVCSRCPDQLWSIFPPPLPRHVLVPVRGDEASCFAIGQAQSASADPSGRPRRNRRPLPPSFSTPSRNRKPCSSPGEPGRSPIGSSKRSSEDKHRSARFPPNRLTICSPVVSTSRDPSDRRPIYSPDVIFHAVGMHRAYVQATCRGPASRPNPLGPGGCDPCRGPSRGGPAASSPVAAPIVAQQ